jgi:hypothetical protein
VVFAISIAKPTIKESRMANCESRNSRSSLLVVELTVAGVDMLMIPRSEATLEANLHAFLS